MGQASRTSCDRGVHLSCAFRTKPGKVIHSLRIPRLPTGKAADNRYMSDSDETGSLGRFLTLADTSLILNITAGEALDLVQSGDLPAITIRSSGSWRVERTVLESYIAARYEEARRMALWQQSDIGSIPELSGTTQRRADMRRQSED